MVTVGDMPMFNAMKLFIACLVLAIGFEGFSQEFPFELSFLMPDLYYFQPDQNFPDKNLPGFLNLEILRASENGEVLYHWNGERANVGSTWYYSNGERANVGSTWYHSNGKRLN